MHVIEEVIVRPLSVTSVEVDWVLQPTVEPLINSRFTILRSEAPEGPYVDISGPLVDTAGFIDKVNLKAKHVDIGYRIRVDHIPSGISVTFPNGTPDESFILHPNLQRVQLAGDFGPDFIALEITRRHNMLLRRFTGRVVAYFPVRTQGARCPLCFDQKKKRSSNSACPECFGTTFDKGFYSQVNIFVDVNPSPEVMQNATFGKLVENQTVVFMTNFPRAKSNDMFVDQQNRRFRVVQVNPVTQKRYIVQQLLQVQEIDRSDAEYLLPVDLNLKAPSEDFIGFFPEKFSPKVVRTEGNALL